MSTVVEPAMLYHKDPETDDLYWLTLKPGPEEGTLIVKVGVAEKFESQEIVVGTKYILQAIAQVMP